MLLKGGISKSDIGSPIGGGGQSSGGGLSGGISQIGDSGGGGIGGFGGGTPWGEIAKQINQVKANMRNTFADAADNANATALAASNYTPNFNPIAGNYISPQNMQTQQSQMSNLYNYITQ